MIAGRAAPPGLLLLRTSEAIKYLDQSSSWFLLLVATAIYVPKLFFKLQQNWSKKFLLKPFFVELWLTVHLPRLSLPVVVTTTTLDTI